LDHTQLNVLNNSTTPERIISVQQLLELREGNVRTGRYSDAFAATPTAITVGHCGAYVNDNYKVLSNLTVTAGVRWDFDGPLTEKYGRLTALTRACILMIRRATRLRIPDSR